MRPIKLISLKDQPRARMWPGSQNGGIPPDGGSIHTASRDLLSDALWQVQLGTGHHVQAKHYLCPQCFRGGGRRGLAVCKHPGEMKMQPPSAYPRASCASQVHPSTARLVVFAQIKAQLLGPQEF